MSDAWSFVLDIAGARHQMASAHMDTGLHHEQACDFPRAAASYLQAARLEPENPATWTALGMTYTALDMIDKAEGCLRYALALDPLAVKATLGLVTVYVMDNNPRQAECFADRAQALAGETADVLMGRGNLLMLVEDFQGAESAYTKVVLMAPGSGPGFTSLGNSLIEQGRHAEAKVAYRRAHELLPQDPRLEMNLGLLELLTGDWEAGWGHYESRRNAMVLR